MTCTLPRTATRSVVDTNAILAAPVTSASSVLSAGDRRAVASLAWEIAAPTWIASRSSAANIVVAETVVTVAVYVAGLACTGAARSSFWVRVVKPMAQPVATAPTAGVALDVSAAHAVCAATTLALGVVTTLMSQRIKNGSLSGRSGLWHSRLRHHRTAARTSAVGRRHRSGARRTRGGFHLRGCCQHPPAARGCRSVAGLRQRRGRALLGRALRCIVH